MTAEVCKQSIWNYKTHCFLWREGTSLAEVVSYLQMLSPLVIYSVIFILGILGLEGCEEEKSIGQYKPHSDH